MKTIKINPKEIKPEIINEAVNVLDKGGVIVYPTDTIYGLGCDIFNRKAVARIFAIKKRDKKKPLSILCPDFKCLSDYAYISNSAFRLIKKLLPGPYTFIFKASNKVPRSLAPKRKTVGIRMPDHKFCLKLTDRLGRPIVTTSVNLSGEDFFTDPKKIKDELAGQIDLILDAGKLVNEPSTVIDLTGDVPEVIRKGKGKVDWIWEILRFVVFCIWLFRAINTVLLWGLSI